VSDDWYKSTRFAWRKTAGELDIDIKANRNIFVLIFISIWLCLWVVGGLFAGRELFFGNTPVNENTFLMVWMIAWAGGVVVVLYSIIWQLFGREWIVVNRSALVLELRILYPIWRRYYAIAFIENLVAIDRQGSGDNSGNDMKPSISFYYAGKTIRFARDLDRVEARKLVALLLENMPAVAARQRKA